MNPSPYTLTPPSVDDVDWSAPINHAHPDAQGLAFCWMGLGPGARGRVLSDRHQGDRYGAINDSYTSWTYDAQHGHGLVCTRGSTVNRGIDFARDTAYLDGLTECTFFVRCRADTLVGTDNHWLFTFLTPSIASAWFSGFIVLSTGHLRFMIQNQVLGDFPNLQTDDAIVTDTNYAIAGSWKKSASPGASDFQLVVNGAEPAATFSTGSYDSSTVLQDDGTHPIDIGNRRHSGGSLYVVDEQWDGPIYDARIYDRGMSLGELKRMTTAPNWFGLVNRLDRQWMFDEPSTTSPSSRYYINNLLQGA